MRKIVLQMMTTTNGRLDDPAAWVHGVSDDQYREIDRIYATFDTVLMGRTTYEEMAAYWPKALAEGEGTETNRSMARRMNDYRKMVFSKKPGGKLTSWNNTEQVVAGSEAELERYLVDLKRQPGKDLHLSGGASFAQSVIELGLVDELHLFTYPVVSPGAAWFGRATDQRQLELLDSTRFGNGVVRLHYATRETKEKARPDSFSQLLT